MDFNDWYNDYDQELKKEITKERCKYIWFSEEILHIVTYDDFMSLDIGESAYKIIKTRILQKPFTETEYIYLPKLGFIEHTSSFDEWCFDEYKEYIYLSNILQNLGVIEYGCSIREWWIDEYNPAGKLIKTTIENWNNI